MKGFILVIGMMLILATTISTTAHADVRIGTQSAPEGVVVIELEYLTEKYSLLLEHRSLKDVTIGGTAYDLALTSGIVRVYGKAKEGGPFLGVGLASYGVSNDANYSGSAQTALIDAGYRLTLGFVNFDAGLRSFFSATFSDSQGQEAVIAGGTGIIAGVGLQF